LNIESLLDEINYQEEIREKQRIIREKVFTDMVNSEKYKYIRAQIVKDLYRFLNA
jgi:hypothetical protein